ncbi:MAG: GtrA family protein [Arenibacterium sp.]
MEDSWARRFVMFGLTGALNFAFGYGVFAVLYLLGMHPQTALVIACSLGVCWNFMTHGRFVFGRQGYGQFPGYVAVYVGVYFINRFGLAYAMDLGMSPLLAQFILIFITFAISFVAISLVLTGTLPFVQAVKPNQSDNPPKAQVKR